MSEVCPEILGRPCVYPRVVEKPAFVPNAFKRLTPCIPGCLAGIALYIHTCKHGFFTLQGPIGHIIRQFIWPTGSGLRTSL